MTSVDDEGPSQKRLESLLQGGLESFQSGDYEACVEQWEELTQHDKDNYRILVFLSLAYNRMRMPELGRGALIRATKIEPRYAKAWNNLGNSFRDTGELFRAVEAYEKAVKLKPKSADYRYNLAITYVDTLQYEEAIDQFRQYRALNSEDDSILLLLASAYYQTDNPQKAFNCVRVFLQRHPKTRDFMRLRAQMKFLRNVIEARQEMAAAPTERIASPAAAIEGGTGDLSALDDGSDELIEASMVEAVSEDELVSVELADEEPGEQPASEPDPATPPVAPDTEPDDDELIEWIDDGLDLSSDESLDAVGS